MTHYHNAWSIISNIDVENGGIGLVRDRVPTSSALRTVTFFQCFIVGTANTYFIIIIFIIIACTWNAVGNDYYKSWKTHTVAPSELLFMLTKLFSRVRRASPRLRYARTRHIIILCACTCNIPGHCTAIYYTGLRRNIIILGLLSLL